MLIVYLSYHRGELKKLQSMLKFLDGNMPRNDNQTMAITFFKEVEYDNYFLVLSFLRTLVLKLSFLVPTKHMLLRYLHHMC